MNPLRKIKEALALYRLYRQANNPITALTLTLESLKLTY
jgi:hypothetical protein